MKKDSVKPVELNKEYKVVVDAYSHEGEGIGRVDNFTVFIPGAIKGEEVKIKITEVKKKFARGLLQEVILASQDRVEESCKLVDGCGGCSLQHMSYATQLEMKRNIVEETLSRIGDIDINVLPTLGMDTPFRYRNNGQFHLQKDKGKVTLGLYNKKSHELISAKDCVLFSEKVNEIVSFLEEILTTEEIKIYNKKEKTGYLRNIVIRQSKESGEVMIIFVTNNEGKKLNKIVALIEEKFPEVKSFFQNINSHPGPVVFGKYFKLLEGKGLISEDLGALDFSISPGAFFQVNTEQAEKLYAKAVEYAGLTGEETVVDAYSGIGTISLFMARNAKKVFGIESVNAATENAKFNAEVNKLSNTKFVTAKVEKWLPQWVEKGNKADVIVVDPPRKGCDDETLEAMIEANPKRIVYVSCNPATLARDLKILVEGGYEVKEVQAVDMFPMTSHIETVTFLSNDIKG